MVSAAVSVVLIVIVIQLAETNLSLEDKLTQCKEDEALKHLKLKFNKNEKLSLVDAECKIHKALPLGKCARNATQIENENPHCLLKRDKRMVYRSVAEDYRNKRRNQPLTILDFQNEKCVVNRTNQSMSQGSFWNKKNELTFNCRNLTCAWDCILNKSSANPQDLKNFMLSAEETYLSKYGEGRFPDAFISEFKMRQIDGKEKYQIRTKVCRDCSEFIAGPLPGFCAYDGDVLAIAAEGCPTGWSEYGEICYKNLEAKKTHAAALAACAAEDSKSNLPIFKSKAEFDDFLAYTTSVNLREKNVGKIWLAGNDLNKEGTFVFTEATGGMVCEDPFILFKRNEPNNKGGLEHCLNKLGDFFNDTNCDKKFETICQIRSKTFCDPCNKATATTTTAAPSR